MNQEAIRLATFANWPGAALVNSSRLAKGGFFYTGQGTEVQCFSCGGKISDWNYGDQVMTRHRRLDPNCAFVVNPLLSGNIQPRYDAPATSSGNSSSPRRRNDSNQDESRSIEEDEMFKNDALRLLSFSNWVDSSVSRGALVSAGFYHLGEGRLRCAWCTGELGPLRNFGSIGSPSQVHRMYFPHCTYAAEVERNMRLRDDERPINDSTIQRTVRNKELVGSGAEQNARVVAAGSEWRSLGVVGGGARHPTHAALASRLNTFDGWPADRAQDPRALADAGFFYTGVDDQVRCFYCDGGLGKWEAGDAPWSEHAHWFPHCGYVLLVKGQEFVDSCRERNRTTTDRSQRSRIRTLEGFYNVTQEEVDEAMDSALVTAVLGAGLDGARVRRALSRRMRATGQPFGTSEALIDAVLTEQLSEEPWCTSPRRRTLSREILVEALADLAPAHAHAHEPAHAHAHEPAQDMSPITVATAASIAVRGHPPEERHFTDGRGSGTGTGAEAQLPREATPEPDTKALTLEEENRQLKEARICKVCMDGEVGVVFLPCGHLVSCAGCGAALAACPLCRAPVRALVRAYLA